MARKDLKVTAGIQFRCNRSEIVMEDVTKEFILFQDFLAQKRPPDKI